MKNKGSWRAGFESISNFQMYYREWCPMGAGTNLPVIALHGSLAKSGMWAETCERIKSIRMICPDQRGFGRSEDPGWGDSAADFAHDAVRLADALFVDRYVIMGHSFACAIALHVARMDPNRVGGVVLADPTIRDRKTSETNLEQVKTRPMGFGSMQEARDYWTKIEEGAWPKKHLYRFLNEIMESSDESAPCRMPFQHERLLRLREFQASSASDYQPLSLAKHVRCPAMVFRGAESRRCSSEALGCLEKAFPKKPKTLVCEKAGHFPNVQEPLAFEKGLLGFLQKVN